MNCLQLILIAEALMSKFGLNFLSLIELTDFFFIFTVRHVFVPKKSVYLENNACNIVHTKKFRLYRKTNEDFVV